MPQFCACMRKPGWFFWNQDVTLTHTHRFGSGVLVLWPDQMLWQMVLLFALNTHTSSSPFSVRSGLHQSRSPSSQIQGSWKPGKEKTWRCDSQTPEWTPESLLQLTGVLIFLFPFQFKFVYAARAATHKWYMALERRLGFRALAGFADNPDTVLRTHGSAHKLHFRGSSTLFCQVLDT